MKLIRLEIEFLRPLSILVCLNLSYRVSLGCRFGSLLQLATFSSLTFAFELSRVELWTRFVDKCAKFRANLCRDIIKDVKREISMHAQFRQSMPMGAGE
jgi:hypothetical protein